MSGHNKWSGIKYRKAAQDSKKSKIYAKYGKIIQLEAGKGDNLSLNPSLANAVSNAKSAGVPKDVIEKAIKKGSGQETGETLQEVFYEGYGPEGSAMYVKCITSNTNRSASNVRAIFSKYGGNMGQEGSVAWQFEAKGVVLVIGKLKEEVIKGKRVQTNVKPDTSAFEDKLLDLPVEDYKQMDDGSYRIITAKKDLMQVVSNLKEDDYNIKNYDIEFIPDNAVKLSDKGEEKLEKLINALEEDDDVDDIFHNVD